MKASYIKKKKIYIYIYIDEDKYFRINDYNMHIQCFAKNNTKAIVVS